MPPSGAAIIDPKIVRGLLITQLQAVLTSFVQVFDSAEPSEIPEEGSWCQIVAIDYTPRSRHWAGIGGPDHAGISITISVGVSSAATRADMGAIDTALAKVASAVDQVALSDVSHRVELDRPTYGSDPPSTHDQFIRAGAVSVTGRVYRSTGTL